VPLLNADSHPLLLQVERCLGSCQLLQPLGGDNLRAMALAAGWVRLPGGSDLIAEGESGDAAFVMATGRLQVTKFIDGGEVVVGEIGPGEMVGEIALLADRPRTARVRAIRDCELVRIDAQLLSGALALHPALARALAGLVVDRLQNSQAPSPAETVRTIALVPTGTQPVSQLVVERIRAAISSLGRCELVDRGRAEERFGVGLTDGAAPPDDSAEMVGWLAQLELAADFVIYVAAPHAPEWTARCLRQADRILLADDLTTAGDSGPSHTSLNLPGFERTRQELLIVHPESTERPTGTADRLALAGAATHHHARIDRPADFARMARLLTGRGIGVVLGGGAARGWAHLGVLRALQDLGIPVDALGGTSIGAVMAAAGAVFPDPNLREQRIVRGLAGPRHLFNLTLPLASLSSGHAVTDALRAPQAFGDLRMEDGWTRLFVVSTNITKAKPQIHRSGEIWRAVRASASIPGVLPPVCWEGDLLIDGAILDNLPIGIMHEELQGGRVIAVDVEPSLDLKVGRPFEPSVSGWRILANQLNPFRPALQVPRMASVVARAQAMRSPHDGRSRLQIEAGDVLLQPPTAGSGAFDFRRSRLLMEGGYRDTMERMEQSPLRRFDR